MQHLLRPKSKLNYLVLLLMLCTSCTANSSNESVSRILIEKKDTVKIRQVEVKQDSSTIEDEAKKFVQAFYDWYLNEIYPTKASYYSSPGYIKKEGYYILDVETLEKRLRSVSYFSEHYIQDKINRMKECNEALFNKKKTIKPEGGMSEEVCYYLDRYDFVTGNGEDFDNIEITNALKSKEGVLVTSNLKIGGYTDGISKVLVNKEEGNSFKIISVEVGF